jgi:hypothetical protein
MDFNEIISGLHLCGSVKSPVANSCEDGSELLMSIKARTFLEQLSDLSFSRTLDV